MTLSSRFVIRGASKHQPRTSLPLPIESANQRCAGRQSRLQQAANRRRQSGLFSRLQHGNANRLSPHVVWGRLTLFCSLVGRLVCATIPLLQLTERYLYWDRPTDCRWYKRLLWCKGKYSAQSDGCACGSTFDGVDFRSTTNWCRVSYPAAWHSAYSFMPQRGTESCCLRIWLSSVVTVAARSFVLSRRPGGGGARSLGGSTIHPIHLGVVFGATGLVVKAFIVP